MIGAMERIGVAVVRVWTEPGGGFRGRITTTLDVAEREEEVTAAASPAELVALLQAWLEAVTRP
jgi:hypothetical protein